MRRPPTYVFLFLSILAIASVAHASDDALAVLGVEAIDVGDVLGNQVTDAIRHRAAELQGLRLVSGKDFVEMKMVFGCDGEAPACLAQAGRSLGADFLIYGNLKKGDAGRGVLVSLKILDVRELTVLKQVSDMLPRRSLSAANLKIAAAHWLSQLIIPPQLGQMAVQSQPSDAQVILDGVPVGHAPLRLKDLKPGKHTVVLQLEGYQSTTQTLEVQAGATLAVNQHLDRDLPSAPVHPPRTGIVERAPIIAAPRALSPAHPGRGAKIAAIALGAGAVIAGGLAIYSWRSYLSLENSASAHLREIAPPSGTSDQRAFFAAPKCVQAPVADSAASRAYLSDCRSGNTFANATSGLWATAGVLVTAGLVSFIVGDRMDAKAAKERSSRDAVKSSLRLVPAISLEGGGLVASFTY